MLEQAIDLGFGVPTRVVALDRDRGHWENELQVLLDEATGWERIMSYSPPRTGPSFMATAAVAFERACELAIRNGPGFFKAWAERRSSQVAAAQAKAAEKNLREAQHAAAAPLRAAYVQQSLDELGRRSAEKAAEAEARAKATPDDPEFRVLAVAFELAEGRTDREVSREQLAARAEELGIFDLSNEDFETYRQGLIKKFGRC